MSTEEERHSLEVTCPSARGSCDDCQEIDLPETPDKAVWCTRVMAVRQNLRVGKKEYLVQQKLPFELLIIPKPPQSLSPSLPQTKTIPFTATTSSCCLYVQ
jgi:hypothetical protein